MRLFCLPFAGGGAEFYRDWALHLPDDIEIWPVQLPGRSARLMEPPVDAMAPLVERLVEALTPHLADLPFAFFGHSMGALISYELAHSLRARRLPVPVTLFLSGRSAPSHPIGRLKHILPDRDLVEELKRFDGTPREVLESPELLALILPILRNDLKLLETYLFESERTPLDIPLHVSGGNDDGLVPVDTLKDWAALSEATTHIRIWNGGHFYLSSQKNGYLKALGVMLTTL